MATKKALLKAIKDQLSPEAFEILGLTEADSKEAIQEQYERLGNREAELKSDDIEKDTDISTVTDDTKNNDEPESKEIINNDSDDLFKRVSEAEIQESESKENVQTSEKPVFERKTRKNKKTDSSSESSMITGYILLIAIDTIFPLSFAFLNNLLDKKNRKVSPAELKLNEKDFNSLEKLADQAASYLAVNINPVAGFMIVATIMYSNNLVILKMNIENN